jgi:Carbamoyltransferase C-terminus
MKPIWFSIVVLGVLVGSANRLAAQGPLALEAKIPLGEVKGRIDHLAVDLGRRRLFVAELGNDSVGVIDLDRREVIHVIADLKGPQGIAHEASTDTIYVANGGDGTVRMFKAADFASLGRMDLGDDADNIRVDAATKQLFIGYASGALAVIDPVNRKKIADIALKAHPESFQLENGTPRIFVNVPYKQTISVIDRNARREIAVWPTANGTHFAMALDPESKRLLVSFRDPPKLGVFDIERGSLVASVETCGDIDDMFVDAKRRRLYVSCDLINTRIKYREPFRPFAPAVLAEYAADYFEISQPDPFMTLAPRVRPDKVDVIPTAVHIDGTGRIQTVERAFNPRYYGVIEEFMKLTGVPVVLNTSFNKQEPIVARPSEAVSCFLRTEMDTLVLGNFYTRDRPPAAVARAREAFIVLEMNMRGGE